MTKDATLDDRQTRARSWFESLRDRIRTDFEALEDEVKGPLADRPPGLYGMSDVLGL